MPGVKLNATTPLFGGNLPYFRGKGSTNVIAFSYFNEAHSLSLGNVAGGRVRDSFRNAQDRKLQRIGCHFDRCTCTLRKTRLSRVINAPFISSPSTISFHVPLAISKVSACDVES